MTDDLRQQELNNAVAQQIGKLVIDNLAKDALIAELRQRLAARDGSAKVMSIAGEAS